MGFLDSILGGRKKLANANADRLFAMATAQVTLEISLGMKSRRVAAIVFQQIANADFKQILDDSSALIASAASAASATSATPPSARMSVATATPKPAGRHAAARTRPLVGTS